MGVVSVGSRVGGILSPLVLLLVSLSARVYHMCVRIHIISYHMYRTNIGL